MRLLRRFFDFYIDTSIHVSLAVVCLMIMTGYELAVFPSFGLLGFVFFGSISGYNFVKYAKAAGLHHRSLTRSIKTIQIFSFISTAGMLYAMFYLSWKLILVAGFFGLLTSLYAVPFPKKNLRNYPGIKLLIVGIVWSGVSVLLPYVEIVSGDLTFFEVWSQLKTGGIWILFLQRLLLVMVFTLPFEIRDLPYDPPHLKTLPQLVGIKKTKGIGIALLTIAFALEGLKDTSQISLDQMMPSHMLISLFLMSVLTAVLVLKSQKKQSKYFASFVVESIPIVWVLFYTILVKLF